MSEIVRCEGELRAMARWEEILGAKGQSFTYLRLKIAINKQANQ